MRGLRGDFGTMPMRDIILYLGNKRATGTLRIDRGGVHKEARIREGMVINASSNQPREYLGQFLINMGQLTEDQFMKAYETQKETKIFIGKILVMIGLVPEPMVRNALGMKLRETLLDAFQWPEGEFAFLPDEMEELPDGLESPIDLLDIHREGDFRETAWQAIRSVFPKGSVRLTVDIRKFPEIPKPGSMDEKLVGHIRDGHSIDDMALALHATDFFLYQRLYALYRLDAVKIDESSLEAESPEAEAELELDEPLMGTEVMGDEQSDSEIARMAKNFLDEGNFSDAETLARKAFEMNPSAENGHLLRVAEQALANQLRGMLLTRKQVPALAMSQLQLKAMNLSAPEKYLLSRVDGERDVKSIIHVSPLQELDALKLFKQFVDKGLVKLTAV